MQTPVFRLAYDDDIVSHVPSHGLTLARLEAIPELHDLLAKTGIGDTLGSVSVGQFTYAKQAVQEGVAVVIFQDHEKE